MSTLAKFRSAIIVMNVFMAAPGVHAEVKFPSDAEFKTMRDTCAGGQVLAVEGDIKAGLAMIKRTPAASVSVEAARSAVGGMIGKINASAPGNALFEKYLACIRNLMDNYVLMQAQLARPAPAKVESRPAPKAATNPTPQQPAVGGDVVFGGSGNVVTRPTAPVYIGNTTNNYGDSSAARLRDFDKLVAFRSAILKEEEKFNSIDKERALQKEPAELDKIAPLLLGFNQFGRSTLRDMTPYLDQDIYQQLQAAQTQLDGTHNELAAVLQQDRQSQEAKTVMMKFVKDSRNFREQLKSRVEEQIQRTR